MIKDRSSFVNKTYKIDNVTFILPNTLKSQLSLAEYLLLKILMTLLQSIKKLA